MKNSYQEIVKSFENKSFITSSIELIGSGKLTIDIKHLAGSLKSIYIATLAKLTGKSFLVITRSTEDAENWHHDLKLFTSPEQAILINEPRKSFKSKTDGSDNLGWMLEGLSKISAIDRYTALITENAIAYDVPDETLLNESKVTVTKGETIDFEEFSKGLILNGFERCEFVSSPGEIAIRGGIVDVFPIGWENPLRIEFWGNEIDSIREFNVLSQRSVKEHNRVQFVSSFFESSQENNNSKIFNYLGDDVIIVVDTPDNLELDDVSKQFISKRQTITINKLGNSDLEIRSSQQPEFSGSVKEFIMELRRKAALKDKLHVFAEGKIHLERLQEMLDNFAENESEVNVKSDTLASIDEVKNLVVWHQDTISEGFVFDSAREAFFTEHQIFDRVRIKEERKSKHKGFNTLKELRELAIGDYVVHEDKGIGRFDGFSQVTMGGAVQDCVKIVFAESDVLYVHLNYINKLSKYSGKDGGVPQLSRLGTSEWQRRKDRAKKRLKDIARNLISIYARRKSQKAYAYPLDTVWQQEFEASFIYEDTPDQASATADIKKDMENDSPMDRLVCGDVGFGKTEVAIRAAFKAAQAGKQVAVLVPTTILAEQHYMTFKDRFHKYPVNVDVISRFRTKKQQTEILEKLQHGNIDILIGTHRLLSKDIKFRDLGLMIIDEEHRFGVGHKEKLREMRATIDTLTLTATPIPRTLNFSLMGARDLSLIETPPRNRLPVETEISEWNDDVIKAALERELERDGQIFFVADTIKELEKIQLQLNKILPGIKSVMAHGQMAPKQLEDIMEGFIQRKYDVLIATKIIESGIDIPNANTMFIKNAENFGLAELYQLRGRVGRTNIQAFCYLIINRTTSINQRAVQRLQAIEEFTDLGSGFRLAMRDLEIRGAGNLLGAEQSGFIDDIGFELFQKILEEAVTELKHEEFADIFKEQLEDLKPQFENEDVAIELDTNAFFPKEYIRNDAERFLYYKKLYQIKQRKELEDLVAEIEDKYGKLPDEAKELVFAVKIRMAALASGFTRIVVRPDKLVCEFPPSTNKEYYEIAFPVIMDYVKELPNTKLNQTKTKLLLETAISSRERAVEVLWKIKKTLETI